MSALTRFKELIWSISLYREIHIYFDERKRFFKEAKQRFAKEKPEHGSWKDYKEAFRKHRVTYSEYMYSYEYWHLNEEERDEFISTSEMQVIYRKLGEHEVRDLFHDKVRFLTAFSPYVHRWWAMVKSLSIDELKEKYNMFWFVTIIYYFCSVDYNLLFLEYNLYFIIYKFIRL